MPKEPKLSDVLDQPTITPEQLIASGVMPVSRNSLYEALSRGEIENFRIGKRIVIPTAPLRRKLGLAVA